MSRIGSSSRVPVVATVLLVLVAAVGGAAIAGRPTPADDVVINPANLPTTTTVATIPNATPSSTDTSSTSTAAATRLVYVVGDSYTGGSNMGGNGANNWTALVSAALKDRGIANRFVVNAVGGSGYLANGQGTAFPNRIPARIDPVPALLIVFGSRNDTSFSAADISAAATATYAALEAAAPGSKLLVIGPPWVNENVPSQIATDRDAVKAAATAAGATFVDPLDEKWFFGLDASLIGDDGVHPTNDGHKYIADHLEPVIEQLLA